MLATTMAIAIIWVLGSATIMLLPKKASPMKKILGLLIALFTTWLIMEKTGFIRFYTGNFDVNALALSFAGLVVAGIFYIILSLLSDVHAHDK